MPANKALENPLLQVRGLQVYYGKVHAVQGIDLDVREGEVVAILGANGAGKSSVIKSLIGLVPAKGNVRFQGRPLEGSSNARAARRLQVAATLSGGEQQLLAIARALVREPTLLLLDEPSLGLAPIMVQVVYETIHKIAERGTTILLAEQSAHIALKLAQRAYVLETGTLAFSGAAAQMRNDPAMREAYLGV